MESGFGSVHDFGDRPEWEPIGHKGSGRFDFFRVRRFGALHFVKRPTAAYRHDLVTIESLKKEFHIGYSLSHPSIVRYLSMENDTVYEEFVDGLTLREMIEAKDIRLRSPEFIERVCRQLLEAMSYLHSRGIVHNDIKPENVMITRIDNQLKLVDLGCAYSDMWNTTEGYTMAYKAPEQGKGETNVYTDIFLIGRLMAELSPIAGVDSRWKKFISKATAVEMRDRFDSDIEALSAIPRMSRGNISRVVYLTVLFMLLSFAGVIWWRFSETAAVPFEKSFEDRKESGVLHDDQSIASSQLPFDSLAMSSQEYNRDENDIKDGSSLSRENAIESKINEFIKTQYQDKIIPHCKRFARMPEGEEKDRLGVLIETNFAAVADTIAVFAEQLVATYPKEVDSYVLGRVNEIMMEYQDFADRIRNSNEEF